MVNIMSFISDKKIGDEGERTIVEYFTTLGFYVLYNSSLAQQNTTEDNYDILVSDGKLVWFIEIKTDIRSEKTGNFFLETEFAKPSKTGKGKPGWAVKYEVNSPVILCWIQPTNRYLYFLPAKELPSLLSNAKILDYVYGKVVVSINRKYVVGVLLNIKSYPDFSLVLQI